MEIKKEVCLREIAGEYILVPTGKTVEEYNGVFTLTPVGAAVFKALQNGKEGEEILAAVLEEFDAAPAAAAADIDEFLGKLREFGII